MSNTWIATEQLVEDLGKAIMLGRWRSGTPEWHEARNAGIGGSDIGAIIGVNPYKTFEDVLNDKLGTGQEVVPNMAMKMGTYLESGIRRLWHDENREWLDVYDTGTWQSTTNARWIANPDGLIQWHDGKLGILEIKYTARKWDTLPLYYEAQVLWYLNVLGLTKGILVQANGHNLTEWDVELTEDKQKRIVEAVEAFTSVLDRRK
jgi:putative phage-type endonuclease